MRNSLETLVITIDRTEALMLCMDLDLVEKHQELMPFNSRLCELHYILKIYCERSHA